MADRMTETKPVKCVEPSGSVEPYRSASSPTGEEDSRKEVRRVLARVAKEAPDFRARAFVEGEFKDVKLSDYRGKWVVLCFYPGDFTFV